MYEFIYSFLKVVQRKINLMKLLLGNCRNFETFNENIKLFLIYEPFMFCKLGSLILSCNFALKCYVLHHNNWENIFN